MNIWENTVLTEKGRSLLAKLVAGNSLNITRAATGTGYVTPGLLVQQTAVSGEKQALSFRPVSYPEAGKCAVTCNLTNNDLTAGYLAKQIGLYATDPDDGEILLLISQAPSDKGTEVPSEAEMSGYTAEWTFYLQYGQADGVTVIVNPSDAVTREEMEAKLDGYLPKNATPDDIGAAEKDHSHGIEEIIDEALPISKGGTGSTSATAALTNLGAAKNVHKHNASDIDSGTLSSDRLPVIPVAKGGTGASTASEALTKLGAAPMYTYGTEDLTAGTSELASGALYLVYE